MDIVQIIQEFGSMGLLVVVFVKFDGHIKSMLASHATDRQAWLESLTGISHKLGAIEGDVDEIKIGLHQIRGSINGRD